MFMAFLASSDRPLNVVAVSAISAVMTGKKDVDARHKAGHDGNKGCR
jgi:hypothetical protein